jgi:hypothetical protein
LTFDGVRQFRIYIPSPHPKRSILSSLDSSVKAVRLFSLFPPHFALA